MKAFCTIYLVIAWKLAWAFSPAYAETVSAAGEGVSARWENDPRMRNLYRAQDEHQITISVGNVSGETTYSAIGGDNASAKTGGLISRLSYCFFIPQARWLALGLGTSVGYEMRQDRSVQLKEGRSYHLPGLLIAANVRMMGNSQLIFGVDHSIERWEDLGVERSHSPEAEAADISINLRLTDLFASMVFRWDISWGVTVEVHRRFGRFFSPGESEGKGVEADVSHRDLWFGSGLTYLLY
jgi:hypothetical protein